jgi:TonB family protein
MKSLNVRGLFTGLMLAIGFLPPARMAAQSYFMAGHHGKVALVRDVRHGFLLVEDQGKLVQADQQRCGLIKAEEYYPAFVSVSHLQVRTSYLTPVGTGSEINNDFHIRAEFTTPYRLHRVFLVLELETERVGATVFYQEIGEMEPGEPRHLSLTLPMREAIGEGKYHLHLFSDGLELLHSQMPPMYCEEQIDRMVLRRIATVREAGPKPFFGPVPPYPESLRKSGQKGRAVIACRIRPNGAVDDPVVESATAPAFGEAALVSMRLWRFLPKVHDGRPQEVRISIPFEFDPPKAGAGG